MQEGSLLRVPGPNNRPRFPAAQFTAEGVVPGLKDVQRALQTRNPWAILNYLVNPDCRLDNRKPIDLLKNGELQLVLEAAQRDGVPGA